MGAINFFYGHIDNGFQRLARCTMICKCLVKLSGQHLLLLIKQHRRTFFNEIAYGQRAQIADPLLLALELFQLVELWSAASNHLPKQHLRFLLRYKSKAASIFEIDDRITNVISCLDEKCQWVSYPTLV